MEAVSMVWKIQEFIDVRQFQMLQDRLNELFPFPSAIIDNEGNILTATAPQGICTSFHRQNNECKSECPKSLQYILDHIHEADPAITYRCPLGLVDNAIPIIIDGVHYGNFFTGQFFLEPPDFNFFRAQAKRYGFDEKAYLEAVREVPVWTQDQLNSNLFFVKGLIEIISGIGMKNLKEVETLNRMRESEERCRAILQTANDGFVRMNLQGEILEVNDACCRMSGYTARELVGMHISELEVIETVDEAAAHGKKIMLQGWDRFETRHRRKDGGIFDVEITSQYRPVEGGQYVSFMRDISEQQRTDRALRDSRELIRAAFMCSPNPISISTLGSAIWLDVNQAALDMFGYAPEEVIEKRVMEKDVWVNLDDRQIILDALDEDGYVKNREVMLRRRDGTLITASVSAGLITMHGTRHLCMISEDITERKKAEEEKANLTARLQQAQKMEAVSRLADGVAHEFNNMLSVVLGYADLVLMDKRYHNQPIMSNMQEIRNAAARSAGLTRQLLAFACKQTISPKVLDLNEAIESILKMLQHLLGEDITLTWSRDANLWPVKMDTSQIDQMLANLCINARDGIKGAGNVNIKTGTVFLKEDYRHEHSMPASEEYVLLTVSDDGIGMDKDCLDKLFEPFFTPKEDGKGTGLELATVHGIVKQNRGFIDVHSEPGKGTTFNIYLPVCNAKAEDVSMVEDLEALLSGNETVLLVEDETSILKLEQARLQLLGYKVLTAGSAREATRLAGCYIDTIHLLLADVAMPDMNGKDLAEQLKLMHPELKFLFMSGSTADIIARQGILEEGVNFIQKPFSINELALKVRHVLDNG
jgi:two-component system, cell cycle sensor histidine kinase and response regulator CckA